MSDLTIGLGLDANGFLSGMRSVEEQAAKGMAALQKSYISAARSEKGLTDSRIESRAQTLRNMGVQEQEIQKYAETAKALTAYKIKRTELRAQYGSDTAALNTALVAWGKENGLMSQATIRARELAVAAEASNTKRKDSVSGMVEALQKEEKALGKTASELKILELRSLGASDAQLKAAESSLQAIDAYNKEQAALAKRSKSMSGAIAYMKAMALAGLGIAGIGGMAGMADEWTTLNNRLKLVISSESELVAVRTKLIASANNTGQAIGGVADLYNKLAQSQEQTGISGERLLKLTDTINKAMVIGGGTAEAQQAALVQLGQAFASGTLRGEELNSVLEQAPGLAIALAKGLGTTVGQLRSLSQAGELSAETVSNALLKASGYVDDSFSKMDKTIGQSVTTLKNQFLTFAGSLNESLSISKGASGAIQLLANNMDVLAGGISLVAAYYTAKYSAALLKIILLEGQKLLMSMKNSAASLYEAGVAGILTKATERLTRAKAALAAAGWLASIATGTGLALGLGVAITGYYAITKATKDATAAMEEQIPAVDKLREAFEKKGKAEQQAMIGGYLKQYEEAKKEYQEAIKGGFFGGGGLKDAVWDLVPDDKRSDYSFRQRFAKAIADVQRGTLSATDMVKSFQKELQLKDGTAGMAKVYHEISKFEGAGSKVNVVVDILKAFGVNVASVKTGMVGVTDGVEGLTSSTNGLAESTKGLSEEAKKAAKEYQKLLGTETSGFFEDLSKLRLMQQGLSDSVAGKVAKAQGEGVTEQQLKTLQQRAEAHEAILQQQKDIASLNDYFDKLAVELQQSTASLSGNKNELIALELSAKGASAAQILQAQSTNTLIERQKQQAANQQWLGDYFKDLEKQTAALGKTSAKPKSS